MAGITMAFALWLARRHEARPGRDKVEDRFLSVYAELESGSLNSRVDIWRVSGRLILDRPWFPFEPWALPFTRPLIGYGPEIYSYVYPLGMDTEALNQTHRVPQYAHNYLIHQTVELGYLGLASYLFILAAFFLPATVALIRNRRLDSQGQKVVLLALVAALAGRSVEQMVGIPHAGDLTVFWASWVSSWPFHQRWENPRILHRPAPRGPAKAGRGCGSGGCAPPRRS